MKLAKMGILAAAVAGLIGLSSLTRADSIDPTPVDATGNGLYYESGSGPYSYKITFLVSGGSFVKTNDFFDLNQLQGATVSSVAFTGAGWTNNSTATDIKFTYTGIPTIGSASTPVTLGVLTFNSATDFSSFSIIPVDPLGDTGQIGGRAQYNGGTFNGLHLIAAPIPSAAWMGSSLLLGVALFSKFRKVRAA
ncbi:MAG: hypothetical protein ACTHN5_20810 [Phycisphaerae bacterium]